MRAPRTWRWALLVGVGVMALVATGCARRIYARTGTVAVYQAPPPAQVVVQRPAQPYANAVWVEGHYQWSGNQYVWVDGYWVQQRAGYSFVQPRWVQQGNRHVYVQGGWAQGGRVVHYVQPAPRRGVYVQPRGVYNRPTVTVQRRGPVYRRGPVVQQRRRGPVYQRRGRVYQRGPAVRATSPRGGSVTIRPR